MFKVRKQKDKYFEIVQLSNRNFSMILGMFVFIGINFPCEKVSRIKYVCAKMLATSFNIFSLYYLTVLCYNGYHLGFKIDCQFVTTTLQFILAMCIRLYFASNTKKIVENCNIIEKYVRFTSSIRNFLQNFDYNCLWNQFCNVLQHGILYAHWIENKRKQRIYII